MGIEKAPPQTIGVSSRAERGTWAGGSHESADVRRPPAQVPRTARDEGEYLPIADYAVIGCTRSIALISREGSIDWLCWPRFDAPSLFARLLDARQGGFFSIRPAAPFRATRRYVDRTNVLETTFVCDGGEAKLIDLMPVLTEEEKKHRLTPFRQIVRRIECVRGEVPVVVEFVPRPSYARVVPRLQLRADCVACFWEARVVSLRSDATFDVSRGDRAVAEFTLRAGEQRTFALGYDDHAPAVLPQIDGKAIEETIAFWKEWSSHFAYDGPHADEVLRSALVLKLMAYAPSGGIIAAPTTSLPECIGGVRNWDYRYCWLRDASFTVGALYECGFEDEGAAYIDWLLYSTRLTQPNLRILYDVFGGSYLPERHLDHLDGYRGSRPVRIGNDARDQFQLDVYAEVLGAVEEATRRGETLTRDVRRLMKNLARIVVERWRDPDAGIWEKRGNGQQHIHGKLMAWSAMDCAIRLAERGHITDRVDLWRRTKDEIAAYVLTRGFNAALNSFVTVADGSDVDASLLYAARVGFIDATDPRMTGTIDVIRRKLAHDDLVYRYDSATTNDGLPSGEGAFLACSLWLVEALVFAKRYGEASEIFEKLCKRGNDVGLFSEEASVESGELLGNFPQALTHIGVMNAALCLWGQRGKT